MRCLIYLYFIITCLSVTATNLDSLQKVIDKMPNDTNKVNYIFKLSDSLIFSNRKLAEKIVNQSLKISEKIKYIEGEGISYIILANLEKDKNNPMKSLELDTIAKNIFKKYNFKQRLAKAYHSIGTDYAMLNDFPNALKNYELSIALNRKLGNQISLQITQFNIVHAYIQQGYVEKADLLMQDLLVRNSNLSKNERALYFEQFGVIKSMINDHKNALKYFLKSVKLKKENQDLYGVNVTNLKIALSYHYLKKFDNAIDYLNPTIKYFEEQKDSFNILTAYMYVAEINIAKEDFVKAKYYLNYIENSFKNTYDNDLKSLASETNF